MDDITVIQEKQEEPKRKMFSKKEKKTKEPKPEWDGNGSGTWNAIKRWYYTRFKGYVILREFGVYWDVQTEKEDPNNPFDCWLTHRMIKKEDLPDEAVHCTGEPYTYSIDHAQIRYDFHDEGFRATDAWLYLEFGGFDDCLTKKWTQFDHVDMKKVLIIGGIAVAVLVVIVITRL